MRESRPLSTGDTLSYEEFTDCLPSYLKDGNRPSISDLRSLEPLQAGSNGRSV